MSVLTIWASLPEDVRSLLIGAAGELTAGLAERAFAALGTARRSPPWEQALRAACTQATAAFLTCLALPEEPETRRAWQEHLKPFFDDPQVQEALTNAVLYEGRSEAVDLDALEKAWKAHHDPAAPFPWREGLGLREAVLAFARAFEREAESRPELHPFLLAARLRRAVDRLERGVPVEGMDALLKAVNRLAEQQDRLLDLFMDLARMGYGVRSVSVRGGVAHSVIITGDNNQVRIADGGLLFRLLPDRERVLTQYRAHLRRAYALLDLKGLALPQVHGRTLDPTLVRIPLDRVYIRLRALPHREPTEPPPPSDDPEAMVRYLRERRARWAREAGERGIPPEEAVREHPHLVILGDPGAGKSTFLRHLAWAGAAEEETLPLLVPLGRMDPAMGGRGSLLEAALDHLTAHKAGEEREKLRRVLTEEIAAKRVLWLLDGLDEVRRHRREVVEGIAQLVGDGHRVVVTSRPVGYAPIPRCDVLYEVLPLRLEEAHAFVDRWFRALAAAQGVSEEEQGAWAGRRSRWMERQLAERPGLREVAQNPLMLTFLAVLAGDEPRREFPRHRKDLYARYVERLFTTWEAQRRGGEE
ncbi:MAG: NACHT domain-containing protein, partial [Chloroflexi bacterium]